MKLLDILREFQVEFPNSAVGGSIGIMLNGIDLKRDLTWSDLDIVNDEPLPENLPEKMEWSSNRSDFDHIVRYYGTQGHGHYATIDVRVEKGYKTKTVEHNGFTYKVQMLKDIVYWKQKYADKGYQKHIDDMVVINGGERPIKVETDSSDDLPF